MIKSNLAPFHGVKSKEIYLYGVRRLCNEEFDWKKGFTKKRRFFGWHVKDLSEKERFGLDFGLFH